MEQDSWWGFGMVLGATACVVGGLFWLTLSNEPERPIPAFGIGDIVSMKLDGRSGMVTRISCYAVKCQYLVRFSAASLNTDVRLLGADGAVVSGAYSEVWVGEFEIGSAK